MPHVQNLSPRGAADEMRLCHARQFLASQELTCNYRTLYCYHRRYSRIFDVSCYRNKRIFSGRSFILFVLRWRHGSIPTRRLFATIPGGCSRHRSPPGPLSFLATTSASSCRLTIRPAASSCWCFRPVISAGRLGERYLLRLSTARPAGLRASNVRLSAQRHGTFALRHGLAVLFCRTAVRHDVRRPAVPAVFPFHHLSRR